MELRTDPLFCLGRLIGYTHRFFIWCDVRRVWCCNRFSWFYSEKDVSARCCQNSVLPLKRLFSVDLSSPDKCCIRQGIESKSFSWKEDFFGTHHWIGMCQSKNF